MLDVKTLIEKIENGYKGEYLFFWGHTYNKTQIGKECLSQWYPCSFFEGREFYNCAEQYMMAQKARMMGDKKMEELIMDETDPKVIKALGKKVKPFDSELWNRHKVNVVVRGNMLKFSQNPLLGGFLLSTNDKVLVQASPYDDIWGIGLGQNDPLVMQPKFWKGQNLLGFALMEVRERLRNESPLETIVLCGTTPEKVVSLKENEIFVFGSNTLGHHGGGAAAYAMKHFGAQWGKGMGHQGRCYAIPTTGLTLNQIQAQVDRFLDYATFFSNYHFLVTKIGCGEAGFNVRQIAPLFAKAISMQNISLPKEFIEVLHPQYKLSKEEEEVVMMWSVGLGSSAKALMGLDPMPSKKVKATAETWDEIKPMPKEHATVLLNYTIATKDMEIVKCGHIPEAMEDHWFMYCDDQTIRYYRSWTGICIYVAHYKIQGDKTTITTLEINRDKEQYSSTNNKQDAKIFLYLLTAEYGGNAAKMWDNIFKD